MRSSSFEFIIQILYAVTSLNEPRISDAKYGQSYRSSCDLNTTGIWIWNIGKVVPVHN
jgi:hypothetical protein